MGDLSDRLSEELEALRQLRDEFRVQLELGRAEALNRWEELEADWQHLEGKLRLLRNESRGELDDVAEAARTVLERIQQGYRHLRSLL